MLLSTYLKGFVASVVTSHTFLGVVQAYAQDAGQLRVPSISSSNSHISSAFERGQYLVGPGDLFNLTVFDAKELSGKLEVLNDGSISLPFVGSINVEGLTINQTIDKIRLNLARILLRPDITLSLVTPRPVRIALIGEVEQPGLYTLGTRETLGTEGAVRVSVTGLPTIVDAIQKAGGITQEAKLDGVILKRRTQKKSDQYSELTLDLIDLMLRGDQTQNPFLYDGDVIEIPKDKKLSAEIIKIAAINLSPQTIEVNVIGEVEKPGRLRVNSNTTLTQAILIAGGSHQYRANERKVELVRMSRNGTATLNKFKLNLKEGVSSDKNPILKNGDTIRVKRNLFAKSTDILNEVSGPMGDIMTAISLYNMTDDTFNLKLKENFVLFDREEDGGASQ
ncbi:polysaccharide biosynthesis/export family protein [Synechococcus sp. RS9902]|uniref:polysaccharide biosynthesis/export family protein n=1 Tax=Synechococcus sp. RS9902 TaxID=221345 RepID=UPI001648911F|nr:polysaccharide biosynthesis/export family protein [Synechococcus sp. RS9902]QNI97096.1 polysaccharide biosynthesis/export protein [Synechococcus sp. RS9902]